MLCVSRACVFMCLLEFDTCTLLHQVLVPVYRIPQCYSSNNGCYWCRGISNSCCNWIQMYGCAHNRTCFPLAPMISFHPFRLPASAVELTRMLSLSPTRCLKYWRRYSCTPRKSRTTCALFLAVGPIRIMLRIEIIFWHLFTPDHASSM